MSEESSQDQVSLTVKQWSAKLAKEFPEGLLLSFGNEMTDPLYRCGRPRVLNAKGIIPKVQLQALDAPKEFVVNVVTYEKIQDSPLVVRIHTSEGEVLEWSANVPESQT